MYRITLLVIVCILAAVPLLAQVDTGTISGTVHDQSGAVVVNASVTATNLGTQAKRTTETNSLGQYTIPSLPAGNYELAFAAKSFVGYKAQMQVTVGSHNTLDATLKVGDSGETVEVVAEGVAVLNTQNQEISQVITPEQIQELPSLTRNPYDFVGTVGNVSSGDRMGNASDQNTGTRGAGFVINGQRSSGTEILLDGAENIDLFGSLVGQQIPQDAVGEYRVITNNFEAQYGRASGGVLNVITKSGTNTFHGSAWEYNRLSALTANSYDNDANDIKKGEYTRNQFGYTFGGPVVKNKLFFFQSTEWLRVRSNSQQLALVPDPQFLALHTPANVQQFFSTYGKNMNAPVVQVLRTNNGKLGDVALGPTAAALPNGTSVFDAVNYSAPLDAGGGSPQNSYTLVGKVDYNASDKTQAFFRYALQKNGLLNGAAFSSPYPQYQVGQNTTNNAFLASLTHTFSAGLLSNTRFSATRQNTAQTYDTALQNVPTLFLTSGATISGMGVQFPGFFDNQTGVGGLPYGGPQNVFQLNHDVSWVKGAHTFRFGGQFMYEQINRGYGAYAQAAEVLGKAGHEADSIDRMMAGTLYSFQVAVDPQGKVPCRRDPITTALIPSAGCTLNGPVGAPSFNRSYRYNDWALYAQDSWKLNRVTLNYGLRYEYYGVQHNSNPELDSNLYYGTGSNLFQQLRNAQIMTAPNSPLGQLWAPVYGTFAPRVGFAWDVMGDGKTSVRGGFGLSYERNFGNVTFNMIQNPPAYAGVLMRQPDSNPGLVTINNFGPLGGTGAVALPSASPRNVNPNINTAQTQMWSLSIERQLAKNTVAGIDYNGAHGVHLYDIKNINMLGGGQAWLGDPLTTSKACGGICYTYPNNQWTSVNQRGSDGYSHYNAMNARLQSSNLFNKGLTLVANYTWAHSLDNISSTFSESSTAANGVGNLGYLNPAIPSLDYGSSDFDIRHRVVVTAVWDVPFAKGTKGAAKQVLDGWSIVPMFQARSGAPFSIMDSTNCLNCGNGGIVRYTPSTAVTSYSTGAAQMIGANNFGLLTLPVANNWNNDTLGISDFGPYPATMTHRNSFVGPGAWNMDFALGKTFPVTEGVKLTFRAEAFNLFNHHNMYVNGFANDVYGNDGPFVVTGKKGGLGSLAGNTSGTPADERRFIQFALRVNF